MTPSFLHILIVEDDPDVCSILVDIIEDVGYRVTSAKNGGEARAILAGSNVDLMVRDQLMASEGGQQLADYAKSLGIPALLISGAADSIDELEVGQYSFSEILAKPKRVANDR
jgi:two-component system OmpR family response regulator